MTPQSRKTQSSKTQGRSKKNRETIICLLLFGGVFLSLRLFLSDQLLSYDFISFYSATKLFLVSKNPYDKVQLEAMQWVLPRLGEPFPAQFWYPPWFFCLFAPFFAWEIRTDVVLWLLASILAIGFSAVCCGTIYGIPRRLAALHFVSAFLFFPVIDALAWNQLGGFMSCALAGFFLAVHRKKDGLAGLSLLVPAIKPHLFLPLSVFLAVTIVRERRYHILFSFAAGLVVLTLMAELQRPGVTFAWLSCLGSPRTDLQTPTLANVVRSTLALGDGSAPQWPIFAIPMLALIGTAWAVFKQPAELNLVNAAPYLCAGLLLAPYANVHDQSVLDLLQLAMLASAWSVQSVRGRNVVRLLLFSQAAIFVIRIFWLTHAKDFFWFPLAMLCLWYTLKRMLNQNRESARSMASGA